MWVVVVFLLPLASCGVGGLIYATSDCTAVSLGQDTFFKDVFNLRFFYWLNKD